MRKLITRSEYMADSEKLHHDYYASFAEAVGFAWRDTKDIERFREALKTDPHMNNIPLSWWDNRALSLYTYSKRACHEAANARGSGGYAPLGDGVCILKAAAREAVEKTKANT